MAIKVVLAKAHQTQCGDAKIGRKLCSVEEELNRAALPYQENTINSNPTEAFITHNIGKANI